MFETIIKIENNVDKYRGKKRKSKKLQKRKSQKLQKRNQKSRNKLQKRNRKSRKLQK